MKGERLSALTARLETWENSFPVGAVILKKKKEQMSCSQLEEGAGDTGELGARVGSGNLQALAAVRKTQNSQDL